MEKEDSKGNKTQHIAKEKRATKETIVTKSLEFSLTEVIIIILITTAFVSVASGIIVFRNYDKLTPLNSVFETRSSNEIIDNYNQIVNNYIEDINKEELIDAAIKGMYDYLKDEYSIYIDKEINESLQEQLFGTYSGIGIEIATNKNKEIIINRVFSNSPAEKAGLMSGDILIKLDGNDLKGKTPNYVSESIKGSNKESFKISYKRDNKTYDVTVKKNIVSIDNISSKEYDNVGYIKIDTFSSTTSDQLKKALDSLNTNINSLVIDLRNNTGGYLNVASDVADLFLEKGKIIYKLKDKNGSVTTYKAKTDTYRNFNKIVIIINEESASASEILTLALRENMNANVVGVKSYGKGTVQETKQLSSGAMVKYTTSYWLSPNGNSINKLGIKPDIEEKNEEKQLDKALAVAK